MAMATSSSFLSIPLLKTSSLLSPVKHCASPLSSEFRALSLYGGRNGVFTSSAMATESNTGSTKAASFSCFSDSFPESSVSSNISSSDTDMEYSSPPLRQRRTTNVEELLILGNQDSNGWFGIDSLKILLAIAAIRLSEKPENIENVLFSFLMDGTNASIDPLTSNTWEDLKTLGNVSDSALKFGDFGP
ncbi:unnamed protein product [Malus baccata var. baccata]